MRILLTIMFAVSGVLLGPAPPAEATPTSCSTLEILAHRGHHPARVDENSMRSFELAAEKGFSIETDVWSDAEGQLWIFHDRDVNRATGASGNIDQMTTAQVAALRYRKAGSPLPTFEEAVAYWQTIPDVPVHLEVKQEKNVAEVIDILRAAGRLPTTWLTSYQNVARGVALDVRLSLKDFSSSPPSPANLQSRGIDTIVLGPGNMTVSRVDTYHAAGIRVQDRNANSTNEWRNTISKGADTQMTDFGEELRDFCPTALEPPTVAGVAPRAAFPGETVTITGDNLLDATSVRFGSQSAPFTVDSPTQISVTVPGPKPVDVPITVTTPNGSAATPTVFNDVPEIASFTPAGGLSPGDEVVIIGDGFSEATGVRFATAPAASFTVDSHTRITAVVPADVPAKGKVLVGTPVQTVQSTDFFTVAAPSTPPTITSFTPEVVAPGKPVTITGENLTGVDQVQFGGTDAASFTIDSPTQITAVVPNGLQARGKLLLRNLAGSTLSEGYYRAPPVIESFTPDLITPGQSVTITGNALSQVTVVRFGGTDAASFTIDSPTQITAVVPNGLQARGKLLLRNLAGSTLSEGYYRAPPVIESFTPDLITPGQSVTITGNALSQVTVVRFGGTDAASFTIDSPTQITAVVPNGLPARGKLLLRNLAGSTLSEGYYRTE